MKITACAFRKLTYIKDNPRKRGRSHSWGTIFTFKLLVHVAGCKEWVWEIKNYKNKMSFQF